VVLTDPVELAHALNPTNDSERLLFRQFLETLVRLDCLGNVHPGLAESWQRDSDGRGWTFTLREGARLPEGMPLTALHVAGTLVRPDAKALGIDSAVYLDDRRVHIRLRNVRDTFPRLFAEPGLAAIRSLASVGGPIRQLIISGREGRPTIDFQLAENGDPRDAIDRGIDLAVTRDPAIVEYVAGRSEFETYPLPWSLTYILLQPSGAQPLTVASDSVRWSLARDAVRAEARPAEPPFWWDSLAACPVVAGPDGQRLSASRIVYPRDDEAARGLAERLVALAGTGTSLRAAALGPAEFAAALRDRTERAYVIAASRESLAPCRDASAWPSGASIQPLIDTRARAIVRRGSPGLTVDWDGTVRVLP
jgi:extracellular solute-binding protein (family 5)